MASKSKPARRPTPASRPKARPAPAKKPVAKPVKKPAGKPAPKVAPKPVAKSPPKPPAKVGAKKPTPASETIAIPLRGDGRRHLLSLSFLRDGDEFLARLETDAGQITELKNRALDQLLTLVAGELEDLLE
jgi:outer membrane biosynthesis protein TonB